MEMLMKLTIRQIFVPLLRFTTACFDGPTFSHLTRSIF
jgi:hypothetical protein